VLSLASSAEHPRNSEGGFATLKSGRILFAYSQFYGGADDNSGSRIAAITSEDQGRTWSQPRLLVDNGSNLNLMSVSFLRLADGRLAMFYLRKKSALDCRPVVSFSADEGGTWTKPAPLISVPGYYVLNNDRVIQTRSGRIIAPVAFHRTRRMVASDPHAVDERGLVLWYYSDDGGATWRESTTWWSLPVASYNGLQEPGAVQLADGSLFSWARTDQGAQYGFRSLDNGLTWSAPEPTELKSPCSPASIKRLPGSAALLAIYNDHSGRFPYGATKSNYRGRTPLVAAVSTDGGRTWPTRKVLENAPQVDFCYVAMEYVDHAVLLGYAAYDRSDEHSRLLVRRVDLAWIDQARP
jgi:hypothetical protein